MDITTCSQKKKIVDVALKLMNEKGAENVTMRAIAERCEMAVGNVTYYFPQKELIFASIYEECINEEAQKYFDLGLDRGNSPWVNYFAIIYAHMYRSVNYEIGRKAIFYMLPSVGTVKACYDVNQRLMNRCLERTEFDRPDKQKLISLLVGDGSVLQMLRYCSDDATEYFSYLKYAFSAMLYIMDVDNSKINETVDSGIKVGKQFVRLLSEG